MPIVKQRQKTVIRVQLYTGSEGKRSVDGPVNDGFDFLEKIAKLPNSMPTVLHVLVDIPVSGACT